MSKFTPDWPWQTRSRGQHWSGLTDLWDVLGPNGEEVVELVRGEATAHLIAAAPELYEALQALVDLGFIDEGALGGRVGRVLAKARGE